MNEQLKQFRARWNLTQEEVSMLLGVKQPAWNRWETGKRVVPAYIVKEMSFFDRLSKQEQDKELAEKTGAAIRRGRGNASLPWKH